jgi:hypothetical protein
MCVLQGNLVIRGYIERYNNPPVFNFVSFHGPLAGVGALPQCKPTQMVCKMIDKVRPSIAHIPTALPTARLTGIADPTFEQLIGAAVYSEKVQGTWPSDWLHSTQTSHTLLLAAFLEHLAQANYFRDPHKIPEYLAHGMFRS